MARRRRICWDSIAATLAHLQQEQGSDEPDRFLGEAPLGVGLLRVEVLIC